MNLLEIMAIILVTLVACLILVIVIATAVIFVRKSKRKVSATKMQMELWEQHYTQQSLRTGNNNTTKKYNFRFRTSSNVGTT